MRVSDESKFKPAEFLNAFGLALTAGLENFAAEVTEAAKAFPDREYWRGYQDAVDDFMEVANG